MTLEMMKIEPEQKSSYFPLKVNKSTESNSVVPIKFPSTRNILWESKPVGDFETLGLTFPQQLVQLFIVEKSLRLAHRYAEDRHLTSFMLGSVYPRTGEGGICFGVDRFDPGREITEKIGEGMVTRSKVPTAIVPGDHIIPITVNKEQLASDNSFSHTKDEFSRAIQIMERKICGKDVLTLSHVVSLKTNLYCSREQDELIITLHCGAIVPDSKFQSRRIAPLPVIPTTLARNLTGPLRLSDVEGTPKMGYVSMDQTRKLLLLLESDPKAYALPLIGIWISGVENVHHPYVWASCLRYLNCDEIKDRVLHSCGSFLLLHYSVVQRIPDFWECFLDSDEKLDFELLSCQETLRLDLDDECSKEPLCCHLRPSPSGMNKELFDAAIAEWKSSNFTQSEQNVDQNGSCSKSALKNNEDPRPTPSPHPSPTQINSPHTPAPEESLSLSFDETSTNSQATKEIKNSTHRHPPKKSPTKQLSNQREHFKLSRQPFKQIIPQDRTTMPNTVAGHVEPGIHGRIHKSRHGDNKENTPLTSRKERNVCRKSFTGSGGKTAGDVQSSRGVPQEKMFGGENQSSNVGVTGVTPGKRRHNSEIVQSFQTLRAGELHRPRAHPSLALSDDDDISSCSSFTQDAGEEKGRTKQSPKTFNQSGQPNRSCRQIIPKQLTQRSSNSGSKLRPSDSKRQAPSPCNLDTRNEADPNSLYLSGNARHSDHDRQSSSSNDHSNSHDTSGDIGSLSFSDPASGKLATNRNISDDRRQSHGSQNSRSRNQSSAQRQFSDRPMRQDLGEPSNDRTPHAYHSNLKQSEISANTQSQSCCASCNTQRMQKDLVEIPSCPSSENIAHQKPEHDNTKPNSQEASQDDSFQQGDKDSGKFIQQHSPNICHDDIHKTSPSHNDSHQQSRSCSNCASHQITPRPPPRDFIATEATKVESIVTNEEQKYENLSSNKELQEQVKRQEDMIRVLQEQVRSLLQMKEAISSQNPSQPLTPAPEHGIEMGALPERQQETPVSEAGDDIPERVTIGVNTGNSLLWQECACECKRTQSNQVEQNAADNGESSEETNVFLTPEKTESLISEVEVQADSNRGDTPAISNIMMPSLSAGDDNFSGKQVELTSQEAESPVEVPVKGREFYDKLLCQVKELLSDQVEKDDSRLIREQTGPPSREVVVKATLKQLEKIKRSDQQDGTRLSRVQTESSSSVSYQTSSTSFIPDHPRLNYISMSVDDTFDEVTHIDEVALKYLSAEELEQFRLEIRPSTSIKRSVTRTVRFGSLPSYDNRRSVREVDFTWNNLSFCTKNYLTKYNLVEGNVSSSAQDPCRDRAIPRSLETRSFSMEARESSAEAQETSRETRKISLGARETSIEERGDSVEAACKAPFPSPARGPPEGSNHILDIKRLKNLPKLF